VNQVILLLSTSYQILGIRHIHSITETGVVATTTTSVSIIQKPITLKLWGTTYSTGMYSTVVANNAGIVGHDDLKGVRSQHESK
jgi:hypothetical protein